MTNGKDKIELLTKIFDNQQALISNADSKSNISLSIQIFIITTVLGASVIVDTFNNLSNFCCCVKLFYCFLFTLFLITSILGLSFCILVFKPRPPQENTEVKRKGITYFGHISKFKNSNEYFDAINDTEQEDIIKEFAFQNYTLAIILDYKMKYVKHSTTMLFVNILLGISLLIFSLVTK